MVTLEGSAFTTESTTYHAVCKALISISCIRNVFPPIFPYPHWPTGKHIAAGNAALRSAHQTKQQAAVPVSQATRPQRQCISRKHILRTTIIFLPFPT